MKKKLIILDFDHTLFNTTLYVAALRDAFLDVGISGAEFDAKRQYLKECCARVDLDAFTLQLAGNDNGRLHAVAHKLIEKRSQDFIFDDARDFITAHQEHFDIIIVTQGDDELQNEKITHSNLPAVTEVIITQQTKDIAITDIVARYDVIYYIDDKAKHIDEIKKKFPQIIAYFMQRTEDQPYADIPSVCECADHVITDLTLRLS